MKSKQERLRKLPPVDKLLGSQDLANVIAQHGIEVVKYSVRQVLTDIREQLQKFEVPQEKEIFNLVLTRVSMITASSLKSVINGTGIIIHTNLGRSPLGTYLADQCTEVLSGYNNLEFDLETGKRGSRHVHVTELLKYLTGAEDALVVNNNAAAVMLALRVFAKNHEVIISRSELIEIGGSFRLPDIMAASDCKMVEIGTTNKTRLSDYENAISTETKLIFKTHKSNFSIKGFTEEAKLQELVALGRKKKVPLIYDLGAGLLHKEGLSEVADEPDVQSAIRQGADLVCFSGDKLLGGPQAGIIVGKKKYISRLKREQMMRALRVGKITLAYLETACRNYLNTTSLYENNVLFNMLNFSKEELESKANYLKDQFRKFDIPANIIEDRGQFGGGTLPDAEIPSFAVSPEFNVNSAASRTIIAKTIYKELMKTSRPVVGILRGGKILFNVLTLFEEDLNYIAETTAGIIKSQQE
jgi:L-seryl-tRNA(Ser) seleniumtransferase